MGKLITYLTLVILLAIPLAIFPQQTKAQTDSLKEKHEKIPLLFLKSSLELQLEKLQAGQFDLSALNYSGYLAGELNAAQRKTLRDKLYIRYLFRNSKNNLGFWGDVLKYANLTGAVFLAAQHISKYGFLSTPPEKK